MEPILFLAHRHQRNADEYVNALQYEDALASYEKAAELFKEAMQVTRGRNVLESLQNQYRHIRARQSVVRFKQQGFSALKQHIQTELETATLHSKPLLDQNQESSSTPHKRRVVIYKNIDDIDSLIGLLNKDQRDTVHKGSDQLAESPPYSVAQATKLPKSDDNFIEELKVNNKELRNLVETLVIQLENERAITARLNETIKDLRKQLSATVETLKTPDEGSSVEFPNRLIPTLGAGKLKIMTDSESSSSFSSAYSYLSADD